MKINSQTENFAVLTILDKVNSQSDIIEIEVGKEYKFKNLSINILKCNNSKFDDDPEVTAYMQVRDTVNKDENKVLFLMIGHLPHLHQLDLLIILFMIFG